MPSPTIVELIEETVLQCRDMDVPLNERLAVVFAKVQELSPDFAGAVERLIARLERIGAAANAPNVGEPMPPFTLPDQNGRTVRLDELLHDGPVAVVFNRGHWCPYCRLNTAALAGVYDQAIREGGQIIAITPETERYTKELRAWADAPFPVLTDIDNGYALSLNLSFFVGTEFDRYVKVGGIDLAAYQNNDTWTLPVPATFVVAQNGRIAARFVEPDYRKRMTTDDLLAELRAARQLA